MKIQEMIDKSIKPVIDKWKGKAPKACLQAL